MIINNNNFSSSNLINLEDNQEIDYLKQLKITAAEEFTSQHRYEQAKEVYKELLHFMPNNPKILYNYARTLRSLNELQSAIFYFQLSSEQDPDNKGTKIELAKTQLLNGEFVPGFQGYELRRKHLKIIKKEQLWTQKDLWDGTSSLENKKILTFAEEGLGDTFQFVRYLKMLKQFKNIYIIGICGQGDNVYFDNPYYGNIPTNRSIPIASIIQSLSKIPNITLYCLQQLTNQEKQSDLITDNIQLFDDTFDKDFGAFMDTAAVMKNLDVVVSVDASMAHLAGGLNVQTFILLPKEADWRWMKDRDDTPWYEKTTLIRQETYESWESVLTILNDYIQKLVQ